MITSLKLADSFEMYSYTKVHLDMTSNEVLSDVKGGGGVYFITADLNQISIKIITILTTI